MSFDAYIQIDGVKGESTDEKHKDWISVFSFSHGLSQQGSGSVNSAGAKNAGKCDHHDFTITKRLDKSSPVLNKHCCDGKHFPKAVIEICRSGGQKEWILKYTLEKVAVSSTNIGGGQGQEVPMETVSFQYSKIKWEYRPFDDAGKPGGVVPSEFDLSTNKAG
jgi:type VI secretion system secreted protein Hcp